MSDEVLSIMDSYPYSMICDRCGGFIRKPDQGQLQWLAWRDADSRPRGADLRVVHARGCGLAVCEAGSFALPDHIPAGRVTLHELPLSQVQGPDGLVGLLSLVKRFGFDAEEVHRLVMRFYVVGYEQAYRNIQRAAAEGVLPASTVPWYLNGDEVTAVLVAYGDLGQPVLD